MSASIVSYILATAGHVDHGKSSLVKALTGVDPDRLPEEKARSMTIDLGFASLQLPSPRTADTTLQVGVVDVPGHEDFVRNMVAGVGAVDVALLVVAADDGWMPQTEEHLQILSYMGVRRGIVALTKVDLAADEQAAMEAVSLRLRGTFFEQAIIVPTSVSTGRGLEELKHNLALLLADTPVPRDIVKPRLPLDRVFTLDGVGTVVTGSLFDGRLAQGQAVRVQPGGRTARVRSIQSHGQAVATAMPGSRVALNLVGVRPGDGGKQVDDTIHRGDVVTLPDSGTPSDTLDIVVNQLDRPGVLPFKNGARLRVHHGAASVPARIHLLGPPANEDGVPLAQLRLERPLLTFMGDRLVLRDWPGRHTLAGGTVLDHAARRRGRRTDEVRQLLHQCAANPDRLEAWVLLDLHLRGPLAWGELLAQSRFAAAEVHAAAAELVRGGQVVQVKDLLVEASRWQNACSRATTVVDEFHRQHPEQLGLTLADVRKATREPPALADPVVASLCSDGFRRVGPVLCRGDHQPVLPPRLAAAGTRLRQVLQEAPLQPPSRPQLAGDALAEQALRFLIINGEVVELAPGCVISTAAMQDAADRTRTFIAQNGPATVTQLKTHLGSSRRIMVPLLEYLDRTGVTRREGDLRTLR